MSPTGRRPIDAEKQQTNSSRGSIGMLLSAPCRFSSYVKLIVCLTMDPTGPQGLWQGEQNLATAAGRPPKQPVPPDASLPLL